MLTSRNVLTALSCLVLLSAGGRTAPPTRATFCEELGCAGGELECFETTIPVTTCVDWLWPRCWDIDVPVTCFEPSRGGANDED